MPNINIDLTPQYQSVEREESRERRQKYVDESNDDSKEESGQESEEESRQESGQESKEESRQESGQESVEESGQEFSAEGYNKAEGLLVRQYDGQVQERDSYIAPMSQPNEDDEHSADFAATTPSNVASYPKPIVHRSMPATLPKGSVFSEPDEIKPDLPVPPEPANHNSDG